MGLIKAVAGSIGGVLADQWKEYFYCDALSVDTLVVKGHKRVSNRSSNIHGSSNIISTGSIIAVADGQCMLVVEQGRAIEMFHFEGPPPEWYWATHSLLLEGDFDTLGEFLASGPTGC